MSHFLGETVPALERTISLVDMVVYAGATWDWYGMHYDPAFAAAAGVPAPVVDGQVFGALFVEQLQDWLGPQCFVQRLEFGFRNLMFAGETVRLEGTVTEASTESVTVSLTATILASGFGPERPAAAPATALVLLGAADGPGAS